MIRPIFKYGSPPLRKLSTEIEKNSDVSELVKDLWDTLYSNSSAVGLAAPQIGINKRAFVIDDKQGFKQAFINPTITLLGGNLVPQHEGCLSIPGISSEVIRFVDTEIDFYDEEWNFHRKKFTKLTSRIVQHEYDHLDGKLWVDHLSYAEQILMIQLLSKIKNS